MNKKTVFITALAVFASPLLFAEDFDVEKAWQKDCSKCHAKDGSGLTKKGRQLRLQDYTKPEVQAKFTDEELAEAIHEGVMKDGEEIMKAYKEDYSEEEIAALVAYIRTMSS